MRRALVLALIALVSCAKPAAEPVRRTATPIPTVTAPATPRATPTPVKTAAAIADCRYTFPLRPSSSAHYGASHHDYPATDIFAPRGTTVVAVTDGKVDYVSRVDRWDPKVNDGATRGGLSVAIVGDDGVRYYGSHLLDVAGGISPGVRVSMGEVLGHVDTSGDARGISPHLHFGISRPTTPTDWMVRRGQVSPYRYLNAWRAGRSVSPSVPGALAPKCHRVS